MTSPEWTISSVFQERSLSCGYEYSYSDINDNGANVTTPKLLRADDYLYAFYVTNNNILRYKKGKIKLAVNGSTDGQWGSCLDNGDKFAVSAVRHYEVNCMEWDSHQDVVSSARFFGAVWTHQISGWGNKIIIAYTKQNDNKIYMREATISPTDGLLSFGSETLLSVGLSSLYTNKEPELVFIKKGANIHLGLFFLDPSNNHSWHTKSSPTSGWTVEGSVKDHNLNVLTGKTSPSVITWPAIHSTSAKSCGVFPDSTGLLKMYCLEEHCQGINLPCNFVWKRVNSDFNHPPPPPPGSSTGTTVSTVTKPSLTYHFHRNWDGTLLGTESSGYLKLIYTGEKDGKLVPVAKISRPLSHSSPPDQGSSVLFYDWIIWFGALDLYPGTGVSIYEDVKVAATKGLWIEQEKHPGEDRSPKLEFLPLADGTFDLNLGTGNDFKIMSNNICSGLFEAGGPACLSCSSGASCPIGYVCQLGLCQQP